MKMNVKNRRILHIVLILTVGIIAYSNTFSSVFQFDDIPHIVKNSTIKDISNFFNPFRIHTSYPSTRYTGYLTFAINYKLHGLNVMGYHIFNLMIHLINSMLIYSFCFLIVKTPHFLKYNGRPSESTNAFALFAALLFISHPIQTQAVTYIVQRLTSLVTMFYLLSVVMYIRSRLAPTSVPTLTFYSISLFSAVLAMKTKEIAFTLPPMIALIEFMFMNGPGKKRVQLLIPFGITMFIIPLSFLSFNGPFGDLVGDVSNISKVQTEMSRIEYLYTQVTVVTKYIGLILFPVNQNLDYDYPIYTGFFTMPVITSFIFLLVIFSCAVYLLYRSRTTDPRPGTMRPFFRIVSFGILWFFITLSVESSVIPITDVIFEHRIYLPSSGIFIAVVTLVFIISNRLNSIFPGSNRLIIVILSAVVLLLSAATHARNAVWKDEIRLWEDVVKKSPNKVRGYNNLCSFYSQRRIYDKALKNCDLAIAVKPDHADAYINRGAIYREAGRLDKAIADYKTAVRIRPGDPRIYNNLGNVYGQGGEIDKAIESYTISIRTDPSYEMAYINRGVLYIFRKKYDMAITDFSDVISFNPYYSDAFVKRASAYLSKGDIEKALLDFRKACGLGNEKGCTTLKEYTNTYK